MKKRDENSFGRGIRFTVILTLTFSLNGTRLLAQRNSLEGYFGQASEAEKREDYAGAERIYLEAAKDYPNQPEILKRLGIVYQTELKFPESIDTFQKVLDGAPQYPEVNFYQGLSYFGLNQFDKAIDAFNKELEFNPKYRRAHYFEAQAYRSLNRNSDALRQYEILLQQDPNDKETLYQLIRFLKSTTLEAINQLGTLDPDSDFMHVLKAETYSTQEKYLDAEKEYKIVLRNNPNFPGVHFALGETYWKNVQYAEAAQEFRLALQEDPNHPMANYYLGDLLVKNQKSDEAVPLLEIAVAANPNFMMAYFELGKCYIAQGKLPEALRLLLKAEELEPNDKSIQYQLAQLYSKLKDPEKSKQHMDLFEKLYAQEREAKAERTKKRQAENSGNDK
jgi:tetratricopeptide (TPR) repeat protein